MQSNISNNNSILENSFSSDCSESSIELKYNISKQRHNVIIPQFNFLADEIIKIESNKVNK
jgi:hypothetical protein